MDTVSAAARHPFALRAGGRTLPLQAVTAPRTQASIPAAGCAPACRAASRPPRKAMSSGMPRMPKPPRDRRVGLGVELGEARPRAQRGRRLGELRRHHPAGSAPGRPEVDDERQLVVPHRLVEHAGVDRPHLAVEERRPAGRALRPGREPLLRHPVHLSAFEARHFRHRPLPRFAARDRAPPRRQEAPPERRLERFRRARGPTGSLRGRMSSGRGAAAPHSGAITVFATPSAPMNTASSRTFSAPLLRPLCRVRNASKSASPLL